MDHFREPELAVGNKPAATHRALKGGALDREREETSEWTGELPRIAATNLIYKTDTYYLSIFEKLLEKILWICGPKSAGFLTVTCTGTNVACRWSM